VLQDECSILAYRLKVLCPARKTMSLDGPLRIFPSGVCQHTVDSRGK
jgi:hypothetical protein